jgi:hypothetical protein
MVIKSAMIIEEDYGNYYTISLDMYDKTPYTKTPAFKIITEDNKSILEAKEKMFFKGDIIDIKPSADGKVIWTKKQDYKDHNYEYAVVLSCKSFNLKKELKVYGNKILNKDIRTIFDDILKPGQKILLEKRDKSFAIIHNITWAEYIYDVQQNGPKIR